MDKRWHFNEEMAFHTALFIVCVVFLLINTGYPAQSRFFPTLVLVPLMGGLVAEFIIAGRRPVTKQPESIRDEVILSFYWTLMIVGLAYLGGLVVSMILFPVIYMRYYCREKWRPTIAVSAFIGVFMYFFMTSLHIPLYNGIILDWAISMLG